MTRLPSVKTLKGIDPDKGLELRKLLDGRISPTSYNSVKEWMRRCYSNPLRQEAVMCAANEILEAHGVESVFEEGEMEPYLTYVNMGDSYIATLVIVDGNFKVGDMAQFVKE